jgi:hypothetical protein
MSLNPDGVVRDISTVDAIKAGLAADSRLSVDDFSERYSRIIAAHYERGGYILEPDESYQVAAQVWRYLRM